MMVAVSHREHVVRHLELVVKRHGGEKAQAVLDRASLRWDGRSLAPLAGAVVGPVECEQYLDAVRNVLGDEEYLPTRVNFILARCSRLLA